MVRESPGKLCQSTGESYQTLTDKLKSTVGWHRVSRAVYSILWLGAGLINGDSYPRNFRSSESEVQGRINCRV